jgi:RimJ/RimL family protein N-acetyltransferase
MTRRNHDTVIVGDRCALVPYRPEHVPTYHRWMRDDPLLLRMTGSEPLSLGEELEMQRSWRDDDAKCTFIILALTTTEGEGSPKDRGGRAAAEARLHNVGWEGSDDSSSSSSSIDEEDFIQKSLPAMVGDVNLFLSDWEEEDGGEDVSDCEPDVSSRQQSGSTATSDEAVTPRRRRRRRRQAEVDIMVAVSSHQRRGIGREAVLAMMLYGATHFGVGRFFCKIRRDNAASLNMFRDKLGFRECAYAACFEEYEFELTAATPEDMVEHVASLLQWKDLKHRTFFLRPTKGRNRAF